jgi:hypothetical protein
LLVLTIVGGRRLLGPTFLRVFVTYLVTLLEAFLEALLEAHLTTLLAQFRTVSFVDSFEPIGYGHAQLLALQYSPGYEA